MVDLKNKWYRRFLFMTVYLVESIITLTVLAVFPILLNDLGLDPGLYGVFGSISLLPRVFKFFIGPISERFPIPFLRGKRRGYIILGAILNISFLPFLSLNPLVFFALFFTVWFFQSLGVAIVDVLIDAMAVGSEEAIQNPEGRTGASAWMFFGITLGGLFVICFTGPIGAHKMVPDAPIDTTLLFYLGIVSAISVIPLLLIIILEEPESEKRNVREDFRQNLKYPFVKMGLLFALLLNVDGGLLELTLEPFVKNEFPVTSLQEIIGTLWGISLLGLILAFVGAKFFIDRVKKTRLLIIISSIYAISTLIMGVFILSGLITYTRFLLLFGIYSFVSALSYITYMGLFFELSDPKAAGTMIALYLTANNLGMVIGIACGGFIPIGIIYLVVAIICGFRILPLSKIDLDDVKKSFYEEEE